MTEAVSYILIALAVLLFLHVLWLVLLLWQNKSKQLKQPLDQSHEYLIIYATQSGNAANLAQQTAEKFKHLNISNRVLDIQHVQAYDLFQAQNILWFVSTYGEGDAPDAARQFLFKIMSKSLDLSQQKFAILALGDRRYSNFCQFGLNLEAWLKQNNAQELFKTVCVDHLKPQDLVTWKNQLEQEIHSSLVDFTEIASNPWSALTLSERELLNRGSQGNPLYRIALQFPQGFDWQSGDIIEVQCANSDARIQQFMSVYQAEIAQLAPDFDAQSLKIKNLHLLPNRLTDENVLTWISRFKELDYREYSAASIPSMGYLQLVIRQEIYQGQLGLGSGWLTEHAVLGETIQARVRSNPSFHLAEHIRPIILIGNGSGIAGLMSHLHQCQKLGYINNWLIYGERQQQFDRGFVEQMQAWKQRGTLKELDLVYSRDGHKVRYVSDCLHKKAHQLETWVERGAVIYVCGSLKGMAQDVDNALTDILGEDVVEQLIQEKRYLRDVY